MLPKLPALTGLAAVLAAVGIFAGVTARPGSDAGIPSAGAAPWTSTLATSTTGAWSDYATDSRGYVSASARCNEDQKAVAIGRTQRSLVVICSSGSGYDYIGERISDGATLTASAEATDDGYAATAEGSTYTVTPTDLTVVSDDKVIYRDTWIDYHEPEPATATSSAATSSAETSSTATSSSAPTTTASSTSANSTVTVTSTVTAPAVATPRSWG